MFSLNPRFAELGLEFFSQVKPTPLTQRPKLVHLNSELLATLGLDHLSEQDLCDLLSSQSIVSDYPALAAVYMGHQFGHAVPRLGDGRALLIAEHEYAGETWELQLKGAGKTPYSRMGDGRAVLRSSIREYLASHAMQHLLVPTTQALALLGSQDEVYREQVETAAVVLRVAPSFIRFGNFEYFAKHGKIGELEQLVKFVCQNYFQDIELSD
ncbi:MAG: YdiU family protein, partial [Burkholderiales bacterium]|nr:YdiU family protein [Burkholderiales bacterium]